MRTAVALTAFALLAAGCGDATAEDRPPDLAPAEVVLRVDAAGGLVPVEFALADLPEFVLTGDGRAISVGPQIAIFPGPALPSLLVTRLSPEGVARVAAAADDAGLVDPLEDYGFPGITDMPTTVFELQIGDRVSTASVYALGFDEGLGDEVAGDQTFGLTEQQSEARRRLTDFEARLHDLTAWLGSDVVGDPEPFAPDALAVYLARGEDVFFEGEQQRLDWPLADQAGVEAVGPYQCLVVEGDDLDTVLGAAEQANQRTRWVISGVEHHAIFRPVLPGETGCVPR